MDNEQIAGAIIMFVVCCGCGALFSAIAAWAKNRKDPMHFWSGVKIDPETVSDIPAYNRENARLWGLYAVPYWIAGLLNIAVFWWPSVVGVSAILISVAGTVGIVYLVVEYKRIEKKYLVKA